MGWNRHLTDLAQPALPFCCGIAAEQAEFVVRSSFASGRC
jgi:hypothetical protein